MRGSSYRTVTVRISDLLPLESARGDAASQAPYCLAQLHQSIFVWHDSSRVSGASFPPFVSALKLWNALRRLSAAGVAGSPLRLAFLALHGGEPSG